MDSYGFCNLGKALETDMPIIWAQLRKAYESACVRKQEITVNKHVLEKDAQKLSEMVGRISGNMKMIPISRTKTYE